MKYGGAALAVTGALVAWLWSHVPVMNAIAVAPTLGGLRVGTSVGCEGPSSNRRMATAAAVLGSAALGCIQGPSWAGKTEIPV